MRSLVYPLLSLVKKKKKKEEKWKVFVPSEKNLSNQSEEKATCSFMPRIYFTLNKIILFEFELLCLKEMKLMKVP